MENIDFGVALKALKEGKRITKDGKRFLYLVKGSRFTVNRKPLNEFYPDGTEISYLPHIDVANPDGTCGVYSLTAEDVLAEDWKIV